MCRPECNQKKYVEGKTRAICATQNEGKTKIDVPRAIFLSTRSEPAFGNGVRVAKKKFFPRHRRQFGSATKK
jgi:hypothetical protein